MDAILKPIDYSICRWQICGIKFLLSSLGNHGSGPMNDDGMNWWDLKVGFVFKRKYPEYTRPGIRSVKKHQLLTYVFNVSYNNAD